MQVDYYLSHVRAHRSSLNLNVCCLKEAPERAKRTATQRVAAEGRSYDHRLSVIPTSQQPLPEEHQRRISQVSPADSGGPRYLNGSQTGFSARHWDKKITGKIMQEMTAMGRSIKQGFPIIFVLMRSEWTLH